MAWYHSVRSAMQALLGRPRLETEMDDEMKFHLEMEAKRNLKAGMSAEEAQRRAIHDFGGVERLKEEVRDERGARWVEDVAQDARIAWRAMGRRPGFTFVSALTLALGIGATTALFGVVKAVLLTPLPYGHPDGIAVIWSAWKGFDQTWLSYDEYEAYDADIPAFADVALFSTGAANLTGDSEPERLRAGFVHMNVFSILEVSPILGRGFTEDEDRPGGPQVVVLGYDLWQRRFGGDPS